MNWDWLKENIGSIIIIVILSAIVIAIITNLILKKKKGECVSCAFCTHKSSCHKKIKNEEE